MILIIDDDIAVSTSLALLLKQEGFSTMEAEGPEKALSILEEHKPTLVILDMNFSANTTGEEGLAMLKTLQEWDRSVPVILITGWASVDLAVAGMKNGAKDFITKPWKNDVLCNSVRTILELNKDQQEVLTRKKLDEEYNFDHIIGQDIKLLNILQTVGRVAETDASVLILGESGTGKELIAEAIHQNSSRADSPFVKVNLGGIPTSLFESELFGHRKGAFTDARVNRVGRFELANTGSIFLDEIGDLELNNQVKLLRVLQDRSFEVLGSSQTKKVDVRVISATNKDLDELIGEKKFREDLFYRINLITLELPPLRERKNDIPLLVNFFVNNLKTIYRRPELEVTTQALHWLKDLSLPGNIRQLKNLVERTILSSAKNRLEIKDFLQVHTSPGNNTKFTLPEVGAMTLEAIEIEMIKKAMTYHNNKISKTARALGITRNALYRRIEKYNIPYEN